VELESQADELRARGYGIAVISYDSREVMAAFATRHDISFPMLSDVGSEVIRRFELLNPVPDWAFGENADDPAVQADVQTYVSVVGARENMVGMAFPGTFMLDPDGRVTSRYFEDFYIERNTVSSIVMRLDDEIEPVSAVRISTAQLDLTTYVSEPSLAPGNRFAIMLSVVPHEGMHVYAPGAADYRVIGLELDAHPWIEQLPVRYPEATPYYFEPFDETVPVYEEPFEIVQELILAGTLEAQRAMRDQEQVSMTGTLEYQACSETICYPPQSVELTWGVPLRALVFERPR
jgi:peroxiredoxin